VADPIQGYFNSTTFTLDANGFPIWNRAVGSEFMAKFAHTVLGNGAAAVTTGGFQVVKKTGMIVTVKPYFICKNGYMMYQAGETDITFTSSTSKQVFYIGARLDVANNHFYGDDVGAFTTFVPATDIISCKLTITANAVAITDGMIEDLRYDTAYCGQIDAYRERSLALLAELEQALEDTLSGGVPAHASTHAAGGADALTPAAIGAAASADVTVKYDKPLRFFDTSVTTASWSNTGTYTDFPYRRAVALTGVLANMVPEVVFAPAEVLSGNYAPVAVAYAGGIYLYAASVPAAAFTIPTITCWKVV
jgi:hypothetical protein